MKVTITTDTKGMIEIEIETGTVTEETNMMGEIEIRFRKRSHIAKRKCAHNTRKYIDFN